MFDGMNSGTLVWDLDKLRIGVFIDTWEEGGKRILKFRPINSTKTFFITAINPDAYFSVDRMDKVPGTWRFNKILLSAENGSSRFLEEELKNRIPEILRRQEQLTENIATQQAIIKEQELMQSRGISSILKDQVDKTETLQKISRKDDEREGFLRRRRHD